MSPIPEKTSDDRPGTANSAISEAPTLIRQFPKEPRWLDSNNDRTGGSEAAQWRHKFVEVIAEHTKDMTEIERTEYFEASIARNKDRYVQTFAAYYGMYPEHIPDRPGGEKSTKKEQEGMVESPEIFEKQRALFTGTWLTDAEMTSFGAKTSAIMEETPGPKDESNPCAKPPICNHCKKDAQKKKWLNPISSVRKALSKKPKASVQVVSLPILQTDGMLSTISISVASTSDRSSLKGLPAQRFEHAQHVEQQA